MSRGDMKLPLVALVAAVALGAAAPFASAFTPVKAPAWRLPAPDGRTLSSDDFRGKVVVLDFWATWCPPCVREIPANNALESHYGAQGLEVIGVSVDESGAGTVRRFLHTHTVDYPVVLGSWEMASAFGVADQIPTTVVIDRDGMIRARIVGYDAQDKERLDRMVAPLLQASPATLP